MALTYAVWDGYQVSKGHTLVRPKKHVANFFDQPLPEQNECWQVANKVQERYWPNGFTVGLNIGATAGQKFAHASIHIIPRYVGDVANPSGGIRNVMKR